VRSDPHLLGEIIQNFVSNAIRYTEKGTVTLGCFEADDILRVDVQDTGIGIDPQHREEIFREFHQIKASGSNKEGFGLGLAIVRRLADLLGHEILVDSTPGVGSRFSVCLPLIASAALADANRSDVALPATTKEKGKLIVLIEDDVKVANAWGMLLEAEGYHVATAASVAEVRAVVKHLDRAPDLVISDFHLLDGSNGVEAVAAIRSEFGQDLPAFIVSGDTSKVVNEARSLSNSKLMSKPVNIDLLLSLAKATIGTGIVPDD
jgi:CheY-like chemotaxis protein